jgi:hypothetical protein
MPSASTGEGEARADVYLHLLDALELVLEGVSSRVISDLSGVDQLQRGVQSRSLARPVGLVTSTAALRA